MITENQIKKNKKNVNLFCYYTYNVTKGGILICLVEDNAIV